MVDIPPLGTGERGGGGGGEVRVRAERTLSVADIPPSGTGEEGGGG